MGENKYSELPDEDLLAFLQANSHGAFHALYDRYSRRIYLNLVRLLRSDTVAEELLQDVFVKVWEHRATVNTGQSFPSYLFQMSTNLAIDFFRRKARQQTMEAALAYASDEGYDHIERLIDYKEASLLLEAAISQLPPQRQRIFRLCRIEGKSYDEVAETCALTRNTVKDHIKKANRFVRDTLSREYGPVLLLLAAAFSNLTS